MPGMSGGTRVRRGPMGGSLCLALAMAMCIVINQQCSALSGHNSFIGVDTTAGRLWGLRGYGVGGEALHGTVARLDGGNLAGLMGDMGMCIGGVARDGHGTVLRAGGLGQDAEPRAECLQAPLRLRGGMAKPVSAKPKKRSGSAKGKVKGKHVKADTKKKKKMPAYNLGPAGWEKKIKAPERQIKASLKGKAHPRKKLVYHFWTHTRIKTYIAKTRAYRQKAKLQKEARPIRNYNKGQRKHQWKWLPSEYEQKLLDEAEAARKAAEPAPSKKKKKAKKDVEEGEEGGEDMGDEDENEEEDEGEGGGDDDGGEEGGSGGGGGGGGGGGDDEEEEFMFPGMGDDSDA